MPTWIFLKIFGSEHNHAVVKETLPKCAGIGIQLIDIVSALRQICSGTSVARSARIGASGHRDIDFRSAFLTHRLWSSDCICIVTATVERIWTEVRKHGKIQLKTFSSVKGEIICRKDPRAKSRDRGGAALYLALDTRLKRKWSFAESHNLLRRSKEMAPGLTDGFSVDTSRRVAT